LVSTAAEMTQLQYFGNLTQDQFDYVTGESNSKLSRYSIALTLHKEYFAA
jgi:hypothetical protein